jgi:hypothetical protein
MLTPVLGGAVIYYSVRAKREPGFRAASQRANDFSLSPDLAPSMSIG